MALLRFSWLLPRQCAKLPVLFYHTSGLPLAPRLKILRLVTSQCGPYGLVENGASRAAHTEVARHSQQERSSNWQVIIQVKRRRVDALGAQENGHLGRVAHLVKHHIPQQTIHGEALPWPIVHSHNPLQLAVRNGGKVSKSALFDKAPVVQQHF